VFIFLVASPGDFTLTALPKMSGLAMGRGKKFKCEQAPPIRYRRPGSRTCESRRAAANLLERGDEGAEEQNERRHSQQDHQDEHEADHARNKVKLHAGLPISLT
jgi:hypothetical protein